MATVLFGDQNVKTSGDLPAIGESCPAVHLTKTDFSTTDLSEHRGKKVILNIFPSINTNVCATSARAFNQKIKEHDNAVVVCVSRDLPFAHKNFCDAEGIDNIEMTSSFRDHSFEEGFKVSFLEGPFTALFSRAIVMLDEEGKVMYTEQVPDTGQEPNYQAVLDQL